MRARRAYRSPLPEVRSSCAVTSHVWREPHAASVSSVPFARARSGIRNQHECSQAHVPPKVHAKKLGRQGRELARERQNRGLGPTPTRQALNAILIGHKLFQLVRAKHLVGIGVEGHERGASPLHSILYRAREKRLVSLMDTIEHTECTARAVEPISVERLVNVKYLRHVSLLSGRCNMHCSAAVAPRKHICPQACCRRLPRSARRLRVQSNSGAHRPYRRTTRSRHCMAGARKVQPRMRGS